MKLAKGTEGINGERGIAIRFDDLTFDEIAREAQENHRSFAAQVRFYVTIGRKSAKQDTTAQRS